MSDIHANVAALRAILADAETQGSIDQIISAGNSIGLGPHPNEVLDVFRERAIEAVLGNYEDAVAFGRLSSGVDFPDEAAARVDRAAVQWTRRELNPDNLSFIENLPQNIRLIGTARHMTLKRDQPDERLTEMRRGILFGSLLQNRERQTRVPTRKILILHGSPRALNEAIRADTANSILSRLAQLARADIVISGHGGQAFLRQHGAITFIGTGAASGMHVPPGEAEYALVTVEDEVTMEPRKVTYDRGPHVQAILDFGLPPALAARFDPSGL
jgi:predicted phosphodiesterase